MVVAVQVPLGDVTEMTEITTTITFPTDRIARNVAATMRRRVRIAEERCPTDSEIDTSPDLRALLNIESIRKRGPTVIIVAHGRDNAHRVATICQLVAHTTGDVTYSRQD